VFDDHGQPMPDVPVIAWEVRTTVGGERTLDFPAIGQTPATTDDRGMYRVYGLPAGEYVVGTAWYLPAMGRAVRAPTDAEIRAAFLAVSQPQRARPNSSRPGSPATERFSFLPVFHPDATDPMGAIPIRLTAGEERSGIDLRMQFRPVAEIEGTVVGPNGPVGNARMSLFWRTPIPPPNLTAVWLSQADGRFVSRPVGAGDYTVLAETNAAGGTPMWASADVTVLSTNPENIQLSLQPALTMTGRFVFEGQSRRPWDLRTVKMTVGPLQDNQRTSTAFNVSTTDSAGLWSITGIVPGRYRLRIPVITGTLPGESGWMVRTVMMSDGRDVTDLPVDVRIGETPTLTVIFTDRPGEIAGTLSTSVTERPSDFFVVVLPADRQYWTPFSRRIAGARPDARGRFLFGALPAGDYHIAVTTDLIPRDLQDASVLAGLAETAQPVSLALGEKKIFDIKIAR
jgi:hypothetical protein